MTTSFTDQKRAWAWRFCRVSQAGEPRGSAAVATADSDGKDAMPIE